MVTNPVMIKIGCRDEKYQVMNNVSNFSECSIADTNTTNVNRAKLVLVGPQYVWLDCDGYAIDADDNSFDVLVYVASINWADVSKLVPPLIQEFARVVKQNGYLLFIETVKIDEIRTEILKYFDLIEDGVFMQGPESIELHKFIAKKK
jgi:ubiquinone/menaquinone biosynthesis C-methylase UbiE